MSSLSAITKLAVALGSDALVRVGLLRAPFRQCVISSLRIDAMRQVGAQFERPVRALELGNLYDIGTAQAWAEILPRGSTLILLDAAMLPWHDELTPPLRVLRSFAELQVIGSRGRVKVTPIRDGVSILRTLAPGTFHLVHIGGCVFSEWAAAECRRVLMPSGTLCGDDATAETFLPDVLPAVRRVLGPVCCADGFWWAGPASPS